MPDGGGDGKPFKSITRGDIDLSAIKRDDDAPESEDEKPEAEGISQLIVVLREALGEAVKDVRSSERLTDSPVCLVADEQDLDMHLERLLRAHNQIETAAQRILEVNPGHRLVVALGKLVRDKGIEGDVVFLGKQGSVVDMLSACDLFLLPSQTESFGLAALEARACLVAGARLLPFDALAGVRAMAAGVAASNAFPVLLCATWRPELMLLHS